MWYAIYEIYEPWCWNMLELIYVINGLSQIAFVGWYIDCKYMHSMSNIRFKIPFSAISLQGRTTSRRLQQRQNLWMTSTVTSDTYLGMYWMWGRIQSDSKRWTHFVSLYGLNSKRRLNTRQRVGCGIPNSLLALRVGLRGLRSKLSWIRLTFSSDTRGRPELLPLHRQPYLLQLVIPTTNALPRWRLNVETKTKRTLYSSRRLSFNELTN